MNNILTFDIEEWYVYNNITLNDSIRLEGYLDAFIDLFHEKKVKVTFFFLGNIARSHPMILRKVFNAGHEIGCHSDNHVWLTKLNPRQFGEDTKRAISSIESVIGEKVLSYRAPAFSITPNNRWVIEILKANGIEYDCSIFPAERDFGGFLGFESDIPSIIEYNGIVIKEFPISTTNLFSKKIAYSGGGYFRLLPYPYVKQIMKSRNYNMTYFHLRDFDKEQKRLISLRYIKNYYGINQSMDKFTKLLNDFSFTNIKNTSNDINWDKVPIIQL